MDERALGLLMRMVTKPYKDIVLNANNAAEAWANLIGAVQPYSTAMVWELEKRWARTTMADNAKVEDHFNRVMELREKLAAGGTFYSDEVLVRKIVCTLCHPRFHIFKVTALYDSIPSLPTLLANVLAYEAIMTDNKTPEAATVRGDRPRGGRGRN